MSTKSQITEIENKYQFNTDDFSMVDRLGSFVGNRKFSEGFRQMKNGENTRESYIWNVLSAVGEDIGTVVYSNIASYIDLVSNIDLCKIRALRSMLKQIGIDYPVFDRLTTLPIELQNLLDILSVNRRYLSDSSVVRKELVNALHESGAIVDISKSLNAAQDEVDKLNVKVGSESDKTVDGEVFDDDKYREFISDSYRNLLSCFLDLEYNMDPAKDESGTTTRYYIRKSSSFLDSYRKQNNPIYEQDSADEFRTYKEEHDISPSFDQSGIVDEIEQGNDSLDNYTGYQLELLNKEITRRAGVLSKTDLVGQLNGFVDEEGNVILRKTRYSYYRRAKVLEYANFIDNKFFSDKQVDGSDEYEYDGNYFNVGDKNLDGIISDDGEINTEILDHVVKYLVNITVYIQKLREKFKLQTRKYYMKGTNLLLRYVINEYLIDYSRANLVNDETNQYLRSLSSHNIDNIDIVEYFDTTEYYNLSTDRTSLASNGSTVNERFWEDVVENKGDIETNNAFTSKQIEQFYLNTMLGENKNINVSNFYDFLDAMYNLGANSSFIDKETGIFQSMLSNGEHVHDTYPKLVELSTALSVLNARYLSSSDFKYDTETDISTQISSTVNEYIYNNLSAVYYDGVYDLYNEVNPKIIDLSNSFETTKSDYEGLLSGNYVVYFEKSDTEYCYVDNDTENDYKHDGKHDLGDYFIDNPTHQYTKFRDRLDSLKSFINDDRNMRNYPVIDTLEYVTTNFTSISSELVNDVINEIVNYGFVDVQSPSLNGQIQSAYDFINKKIESRQEYLTEIVNSLKTQANQALEAYNAANNSFNQAIATYSDNSESYTLGDSVVYCFSLNKPGNDEAKSDYNKDVGNVCSANAKKPSAPYDFVKYCSVNGLWYYGNKKGSGSYGYDEQSVTPYNENDSLEARCSEVQDYINAPTAFQFVYDTDGSYSKQLYYELKTEGIQATIDTTIQTLGNVQSQHDSIVSQMENLGIDYVSTSTGDVHSDLLHLIEFLTTTLDESFLGDDKLMLKYKELLAQTILLSADYTTINDAYERLFQDSKQVWYFSDYVRTLNPTLKELLKLSTYCDGQDVSNREVISRNIEDLYKAYNGHLDTFNTVAEELSVINYRVPTSPLEDQLEDISKTLQADLDLRLYNAKTGLENEIQDEVQPRFDIISTYLSDILDQKLDLGEKAQEKVDELNFFTDPQYLKANGLFERYTGLPEISEQAAYNHKNKAHPSYQVHPFLWSFVEREDSMVNTLSKSINSIYPTVTPDLLTQFVGQFGQVINMWKTESQFFDTTGYASRYEVSQNQPKNVDTKLNEVVDYDGAFYPPAVEMLRTDFDGCLSSLQNRTGEFYRRFFSHLGMNDVELSRECQQIKDYYPLIKDITDDHDLPSVYDIYKYALDANGNSFVLYKKYGKEEPSYREMRNTPGEVWIRLSEHPFAFPAFTGLSSQVVDVSESTNGAIRQYLSADEGKNIYCDISNDTEGYRLLTRNVKRMRCFYDLHFTKNKQNITLIGKNLDSSVGRDLTYDNAWVIYSQLEYSGNDTNTETYSKIGFPTTNSVGERTTDYVACGTNMLTTDNDGINLIGIYQKGINEIWSVYVENTISNGKDPYLTLWRCNNSQAQTYINGESIANLQYPPISNDWCVSYNSKDDKLTFAYIAKLDDDKFNSGYTKEVDYDNAEGAVIDDPQETEMNSHDILDGRVVTFDLRLKGKHIQVDNSDIHSYNLNADMSYSPLYPGKEHQADISKDRKDFYSLELLGESKNIDYDIGLVNTSVNPYFNYEDMYDEGLFGRVFESYLSAEDKSLKVIRNRSLFKNFPTDYEDPEYVKYGYVVDGEKSEYAWTICLSDINFVDTNTTREHKTENRYNDHDYKTLQVLIYNRNTLGKNPYFIGTLSDLTVSGETVEIPIMYSDKIENSEQNISSDVFTNGRYCCYSETYSLSDSLNSTGNNRLTGIGSISATYNGDEKKLGIRFIVEKGMEEFAHVPSSTVEVLLYNPYDLTMFEKYHMLDAYGLIKDIRLRDTIKNNVIGDGWQIVYDDYMKYSKAELDNSIPYYLDDGLRHYLSDINLSDYSYLSDVFVFNTEKKLGFKYDEELRFDLSNDAYFYPSLNRKYPKNAGSKVATGMFSTSNSNDLNYVKSIFSDKNLFIFNLDSGSDVADSIGTIDIDSDNGDTDEFRAFEDYYDDENYQRYDEDDPQSLQFLHFTEIDNDNSIISNIADEDYKKMTSEGFADHMEKKYGITLSGLKSEETQNMFVGSDISFEVNSSNINLDNSCKLYVNYKKDENDDLILYFNYFNYLETPYVKINDGQIYPDIVENTYLKLKPGESGVLDIVVQFRYYYGNRLSGVKNVKTLSYMLYNVSDDKPKFVAKKVYTVRKDEYRSAVFSAMVAITSESIVVVIHDLTEAEKEKGFTKTLDIYLQTGGKLSSEIEFNIDYPYQIFSIEDGLFDGYEIESSTAGYAHVKVTRKSLNRVSINAVFKPVNEFSEYVNTSFLIGIDKIDLVDSNGMMANVTTENGYVTIKQ